MIFLHAWSFFPINFFKLGSVVDLLAKPKYLLFALSESTVENEYVTEKELACYYYIQEAVLVAIDVLVFSNLLINLQDFLSDFILQDFVFTLLDYLVALNISVKLIQEGK